MQLSISQSERLIAEVDGAIGWIVFNNPAKRNAVSADMAEAIIAAVDHFEQDPAVRVIVLKGAGDKAFVSGGDLTQYGNPSVTRPTYPVALRRLRDATKPTVAMIHGYCIGGGMIVALYCDLRIADDTARFGLPQAKLGRPPNREGFARAVNLIGAAYVKEMVYTGRQYSSDEAHAMGLINRVVPDGELEEEVRRVCSVIAENAPLSIDASRATIDEIGKIGPATDIEKCEALAKMCTESQDFIEGPVAFREKRPAVFVGR